MGAGASTTDNVTATFILSVSAEGLDYGVGTAEVQTELKGAMLRRPVEEGLIIPAIKNWKAGLKC